MSTPRYELEISFNEFKKLSSAGRECFHHEINNFIETCRSIAAARNASSMIGQYLEMSAFDGILCHVSLKEISQATYFGFGVKISIGT